MIMPSNFSAAKLTKATLTVTALVSTLGCVERQPADQPVESVKSDQVKVTDLTIWPNIESEVKSDPVIERKVADLLATMTLQQKVAQMIQPEIRDISVEDMRTYGFGSYLNGGGAFPNNNKQATPHEWISLAEQMYQASVDDSIDGINIPTMWGTDAVHGHNNVVGATLFPHNIGLGAANNPALIEKIAQVTATEVMVTGIDWVFAPTVATVRDDRWGRTYEGYSEDPEIVKSYAAAIVRGLQGSADDDFLSDNRVISTVKHFIGDGGTKNGDDQGDNVATEQELFDIHAQGYVGGLTAGAQSVMASFNSWHGQKIHGHQYLLTDVLKTKMGFDGFVVGDWNGHGQIKGCSNDNCPQAVNAGLDMFMVPTNAWKPLLENTVEQVNTGVIPVARIDDAVSRILRVKFRAGLFDKPSPENRVYSGKTELIGHEKHRQVARQAVRESLVLLKNNQQLLPLSPNTKVLVAGDAADNIGKQSGGWTITWQGTGNQNTDFPGGRSIYSGILEQVSSAGGQVELNVNGEFKEKPDVAIVVFGEEPYAEGHGDIDNLEYQRGNKKDLALLAKLKAQNIPVVAVFISGRPLWVNAELNASDAFIAAWLPGSEGHAIAEVIFKNKAEQIQYDFKGKLTYSWPNTPDQTDINRHDKNDTPLLPYGFGLTYGDESTLSDNLSEAKPKRAEIDGKSLELHLFNRAIISPWQGEIRSGTARKLLSSNTVELNSISYRTSDRFVQEDTINLVYKGQEQASFVIANVFREDLRAFTEQDSVIMLEVKVNQKTSDKVFVEMDCQTDCQSKINISKHLNALEQGKWHRLSIPLSCFTEQGTDMSTMTMPFKLVSQGRLNLDIHQVSLFQVKPESLQLSCH